MRILRALWRDPRFRLMVEAIVCAIAGYLTAVITGVADSPLP